MRTLARRRYPMTARVEKRSDTAIAAVLDTARGRWTMETSADVELDTGTAPWVPAIHPIAARMATSLDLRAGADVSPAVDRAQRAGAAAAVTLLASWFPEVDAVPLMVERLEASSVLPAARDGRGVGCFFSLGVDSFHAVRKHGDEVTHLIFVLGFDIADPESSAARLAVDRARLAADELGKELIVVRTTVRSVSDPLRVPWGRIYHGPALAHVALALSPVLAAVVVPSSPPTTVIRGSHPHLDPLWSSERVRIVHDDDDPWRPTKIAELADYPAALNNLRVCYQDLPDTYNCGACLKCISTALCLRIAGGRSETLSTDVSPATVRSHHLDPAFVERMEWIAAGLRERNDDAELIDAVVGITESAKGRSRLQAAAEKINTEIYLRL